MLCGYCKQEGHKRNKCAKMLEETGTNIQCEFCNQLGHQTAKCQAMRQTKINDMQRYEQQRQRICQSILKYKIGIGTIFIDEVWVSAHQKHNGTFIVKDFDREKIFRGSQASCVVCSVIVNGNMYNVTHSLSSVITEAQGIGEIPEWVSTYARLKLEDIADYWPEGFKSFLTKSDIQRSNEIAKQYSLPSF